MAIISENISGVLLNVPDDLPAPKTRKAIQRAVASKLARQAAQGTFGDAVDRRRKLDGIIADEYGAILDNDPDADLPDARPRVTAAKAEVEDARRDLDVRINVEQRAAQKVRKAVAEELPLLARTALAEGDTALAMLSAVLEDAIAARDALWSSIGVGRMAARLAEEPGAPIAIQHKAYGYTFDLEAVIEGLHESLAKASAELTELRGDARLSTGKKTRKPRKAASEAHSPAQTAATPDPALGNLTIGEDDDD
ncbi:hypothetical protein ACCO44_08130 [Microbacterium maritypicum]|uniref:hypothetical protein n=1 Tax=Microbacterium maritypicum TaxID=33918 RepID=UPI0035592343